MPVAAFHTALDTAQVNVVQIDLTTTRKMWLGINDNGDSITAGPIVTDARQFLVDLDTARGVQFWILNATTLTVDGQQLHSSGQRETKEILLP